MVPDLLRLGGIFLLGMTVALKWPILWAHSRQLRQSLDGYHYDPAARALFIRSAAHVLALVYIAADLFARVGQSLTWRLPAAYVVLCATVYGLIATHRADRAN